MQVSCISNTPIILISLLEKADTRVKAIMLSGPFQVTALLLLALSCGAYGQGKGLSEDEMGEILNAHNFYRRTVDPIATNMLKMVYYVCSNCLFLITHRPIKNILYLCKILHTCRNGVKSWPTWLSSGPPVASTWRMKTGTVRRESSTM